MNNELKMLLEIMEAQSKVNNEMTNLLAKMTNLLAALQQNKVESIPTIDHKEYEEPELMEEIKVTTDKITDKQYKKVSKAITQAVNRICDTLDQVTVPKCMYFEPWCRKDMKIFRKFIRNDIRRTLTSNLEIRHIQDIPAEKYNRVMEILNKIDAPFWNDLYEDTETTDTTTTEEEFDMDAFLAGI